jgi:hypothetical protein
VKIYKFYLKPTKDADDKRKSIGERYTLYALTNKKKLAKLFKKQRDMSKFLFKTDSVDFDEWSELANGNNGSVLSMYSLTTCDGKIRTIDHRADIDILMTLNEKSILDDGADLFELSDERFWECMPIPIIFKKKYQLVFELFQITVLYKLYRAFDLPNNIREEMFGLVEDDYQGPEFEIDELKKFISAYINILK